MLKIYACIVLIFTTSLSYGMFPLSWDLSDNWSSIKQHRILSEDEKKQKEKEDYDTLHALVLSTISGQQDLNLKMLDTLGEQTLLHKSCMGGDAYLPITQLLLTHGANTHVIDTHKSTPLHHAVDTNAIETVKLLLAAGADADAADMLFGTPLQGICARAYDVLHDESIAKKRVRIAQLLLKHGANPNVKDDYQSSCFHGVIASPFMKADSIDSLKNSNKNLFFSQRKALIRALVLYGANLNAVDSRGKTAIQEAHQAIGNPNQPYFIELADYALNYARARLLCILGHSGARPTHETPFKALPKDIVNIIIHFVHPDYIMPQIATEQK